MDTPYVVKTQVLFFIRYLLLFLQIGVVFRNEDGTSIVKIVLIFLVFIINQVRYYVLDKNIKFYVLFCVLELIGIAALGNDFSSYYLLLYLPLILDIAILNWPHKHYMAAVIVVFGTFNMRHFPANIIGMSLLVLVVFYILITYISYLFIAVRDEEHAHYKASLALDEVAKDQALQNQELENREELALLRERNRISREIHDSVGHSLSTIIIQLSAIAKLAEKNPKQAGEMAGILSEFSKDSLDEIRIALRELKPRTYSAYGLILQIDDICKEQRQSHQVEIRFRYNGNIRQIHEAAADSVLAITKEFITNSLRHGQAKMITLNLHFRDRELIYALEDDGEGIDLEHIQMGIGLRSIRERTSELKGEYKFDSSPGEGFRIRIVLPLDTEEGA